MKAKTKRLTTCAIFASIICIVTTFVAVPAPAIGNINLGDVFILCAAWILGPWGAISAGIGACLADLFSGFAIYAPATLIIKALMTLVCYYLYVVYDKIFRMKLFSRLFSALVAEGVMVIGYFLYESIIYGFPAAFANIPFNLIQGTASMIIASVSCTLLFKNHTVQKFSKQFIS